jgi:hypothetical protein
MFCNQLWNGCLNNLIVSLKCIAQSKTNRVYMFHFCALELWSSDLITVISHHIEQKMKALENIMMANSIECL